MLYAPSLDALHRRRLIVAGTTVVLLLIAFVTYSVLVHRSHLAHAATTMSGTSTASPSTGPADVPANLPALQPTDEPQQLARETADAVFTWDTASMTTRSDHIEQLLALGDPTGESTAGLLSDLGNYLPTDDAWTALAAYETRQWLTIESLSIPTKWAEAQMQAGKALLPGTTAYTIRGTRHRSGVWDGSAVSTEHPVAFTVFIVCRPSYPTCHLLRLSELDNPLN